jgi:hypothetical protein
LAGLGPVVFALAVYPACSVLAGQRSAAFPTFGLPCPTALFTLGMLALLVPPYPRAARVAPVLCCLVGAQAAFALSVALTVNFAFLAFLDVSIGWPLATARLQLRTLSGLKAVPMGEEAARGALPVRTSMALAAEGKVTACP